MRLKGEGEISLMTLQQKRASSRVDKRISWVFSSCGRKHGVPLELRQGPQWPARVASGKSRLHLNCQGPLRIHFQLGQRHRASSGICGLNLRVPLYADMDLRVPMEFQQGSQASFHVETWNSAFLSRCQRGVRVPVEST